MLTDHYIEKKLNKGKRAIQMADMLLYHSRIII